MRNRPDRTTFKTRMDELIATVMNDILTDKYKVDDLLPSEQALTEQFRLSKKSVRKALDTLVEQGYIEKLPRVGARVICSNPGNQTTVKFGYYPSLLREANLLSIIDAFHKRYPNIRVQLIPLPFGQQSPTMKENMERESIDLVTINTLNYELFLKDGPHPDTLEPLERNDDVYPFLTKPFTADDTLYVQPFLFSPIVLCYNKSHFDEVRVAEPDSSWTWSDVMRAAEALNGQQGRLGILFNLLSTNRWPLFLLQNDVTFHTDESGRMVFQDRKLKEALEMCRGLIVDGTSSMYLTDDEVTERLFLHQKVSMIVTSYFSMNMLQQSGLDFDISPLPYTKEARTLLVVIGLAINRNSTAKKAAHTLMDFLLSYETQLGIRKHTLSIPSLKSAAEYRERKETRPYRYQMYRDIIPTFRFHSDLNISFDTLIRMNQELSLYWAKMEDVDTLLRRLEEMEKTQSPLSV
jgi:multiple sugar transport system substrate-binding protein